MRAAELPTLAPRRDRPLPYHHLVTASYPPVPCPSMPTTPGKAGVQSAERNGAEGSRKEESQRDRLVTPPRHASPFPPAVTISVPSPLAEAGPTSPSQPSVEGGSADLRAPAASVAAGRHRPHNLPRNNTPAGLVDPTPMPSGRTGRPRVVSPGDEHDGLSLGSNTEGGSPVSTQASAGNRARGRGANGSDHPSPLRRAITPKVDYHNAVRRGSRGDTFSNGVGDPEALKDFVVVRRNAPQGGTDPRHAVPPHVSATPKQMTRAVSPRQAKASEWIFPGIDSDLGGASSSSAGALPGRANIASRRGPAATQVVYHGGTSTPWPGGGGSGQAGGILGASVNARSGTGSLHDGVSSSQHRQMMEPRGVTAGLPRQLALAGALGHNQGVGFPLGERGRQGDLRGHSGAGGSEAPGRAELNNLHPAWKPKSLRRRQSVVSVVERDLPRGGA